jgi:hypothetical protein
LGTNYKQVKTFIYKWIDSVWFCKPDKSSSSSSTSDSSSESVSSSIKAALLLDSDMISDSSMGSR